MGRVEGKIALVAGAARGQGGQHRTLGLLDRNSEQLGLDFIAQISPARVGRPRPRYGSGRAGQGRCGRRWWWCRARGPGRTSGVHNGHPSGAETAWMFPPRWCCLPDHHRSTPRGGAGCGVAVAIEGAVEDHVAVPGRLRQQRPVQRGLPRGQHRDRLVSIGVRGRAADLVVAGQRGNPGIVEEPPQYQHRLLPGGQHRVFARVPRRRRSCSSRPAANPTPSSDTSRTAVYETLTAAQNPPADDLWSDHLL